MKYNEKYQLYIDDDFIIYKWNRKYNRLTQCKPRKRKDGYLDVRVQTKLNHALVHRVIWETFVGEIPEGYQLDHINTVRDDNRLENLRVVTKKENMNNPITKTHISDASKKAMQNEETRKKISDSFKKNHEAMESLRKRSKGNQYSLNKFRSRAYELFKEYYGIEPRDNWDLWLKVRNYYHSHKELLKVCS